MTLTSVQLAFTNTTDNLGNCPETNTFRALVLPPHTVVPTNFKFKVLDRSTQKDPTIRTNQELAGTS